MARFLISVMPFTGHVAPLSAVAAELVRRGHDVRVYTGSAFRGRIEAAGGTLVPWRAAPDFDENDLPATFPRLLGKKGLSQLLINMEDLFINTAPKQNRGSRCGVGASAVGRDGVGRSVDRPDPLRRAHRMPVGERGGAAPESAQRAGTADRDRAAAGTQSAHESCGMPCCAPRCRWVPGLCEHPPSAHGWRSVCRRRRARMTRRSSRRQLIVASGVPALDHHRTDRPAWVHYVGELTSASARSPSPNSRRGGPSSTVGTVVHVTQGTQNIDPDDLIRPAIEALADRTTCWSS